MKLHHKLLVYLIVGSAFVCEASAFYDPSIQRWPNRDPLSGSLLENVVAPAESIIDNNLYRFVHNSTQGSVDPDGLDVWVIRQDDGWGHEWVVGDNGDGTFWDSDKQPGPGGFRIPFFDVALNCPTDINFTPKSDFNPRKLKDGFTIKLHVKTSPWVDKRVKDEAQRRSKENPGRYDACAANCRDYARGIAGYAKGQRLREAFHGHAK